MNAVPTVMHPDIDVNFSDRARDRSLEATLHRWVARFEAMSFEVHGAAVTIEPSGRDHTAVCLTMTLAGGTFSTAVITHECVSRRTTGPARARPPDPR